jgi:hypothetical protein
MATGTAGGDDSIISGCHFDMHSKCQRRDGSISTDIPTFFRVLNLDQFDHHHGYLSSSFIHHIYGAIPG